MAANPERDPHLRLAQSRLGTLVRGKWHLDSLLGVGGMAAVYAATHRNGNRVALKMLHPLVADDEGRRRFLREGYLANAVGHPGVVQVLDDDPGEDGAAFLVMELLEGESLESYASRRIQLPPAEALGIAEQILDILVAAHRKNIVHRDVKPENVFLCEDRRVKLLDFGIARLHEHSNGEGTHHGLLLGTPLYMAPEQARGNWKIVDGRTDVFSVGATLFRVLTGHTVHRGNTYIELLTAAASNPAPKLQSMQPHAPDQVAELVDRALEFEMSDRWESAAVMLERTRAVQGEMGFRRASQRPPSDLTVQTDVAEEAANPDTTLTGDVAIDLLNFDETAARVPKSGVATSSDTTLDDSPTAIAVVHEGGREGSRRSSRPAPSTPASARKQSSSGPPRSALMTKSDEGRRWPWQRNRSLAIGWAVAAGAVVLFLVTLVWRITQ